MSEQLYEWQNVVIDFIKNHEEQSTTEEMMELNRFDRNDSNSISIKLPRKTGHTYLASYISCIMKDVALVYTDVDHFRSIRDFKDHILRENKDAVENKSKDISIYELYYVCNQANMVNKTNNPLVRIDEVKNKIKNKSIIVVDDARVMPPHVKDFLLTISEGVVVFLN